jgi:hypothetical protein
MRKIFAIVLALLTGGIEIVSMASQQAIAAPYN